MQKYKLDLKLVIARYNEDVSWVGWMPSAHFPVLIYNKGEKLEPPRKGENVEIVNTPNIGREQYTFYSHIYHNYHNLDEHTAFLQAGALEHLTQVLYNPNRARYFSDPKNGYAAVMMLENNLRPHEYCSLGAPVHGKNHMQSFEMTEHLMKARKILFPNLPEDFEYYFGAGGMFIASRAVLHKYPRSFYKQILDMWDNSLGMYNHNGRDELVEDFLFEHFSSFMYTL